MTSTWRVLISPKLWNVDSYIQQWNDDSEIPIYQSKGRAIMRDTPQKDDIINIVVSGHIRMKGVVVSDGFIQGNYHQSDENNIGIERSHAEPELYATIRIMEILDRPEPIPFKGYRSWIRL